MRVANKNGSQGAAKEQKTHREPLHVVAFSVENGYIIFVVALRMYFLAPIPTIALSAPEG